MDLTRNHRRRLALKACLAGAAAVVGTTRPAGRARAADWPSRPIRFITQSAAGDPVEGRLREFVQGVSDRLGGIACIVENKPGAAGVLAQQTLLNAPADGHTVLLTNATVTIFPTLHRKLKFDPLRDFQPVALSGLSPIGLAIPASRPETTLAGWLSWARSRPRELNYASPGNGSVSHLYGLELDERFGLQATHVPYKGAQAGLLDMTTGQIHFTMLDTFSLRPMLQKQAIRLLAVSGDARSPYLPEVPTFAESGHRGFDRMGWTAYYVRSGTPPAILEPMSVLFNEVNASAHWIKRREQLWSVWQPLTPAELSARVRAETAAWAGLIHRNALYAD